MSSGNSSTWPGELDLDGLSNNRISTTIGNKLEFKKFNTKPIYIVVVGSIRVETKSVLE